MTTTVGKLTYLNVKTQQATTTITFDPNTRLSPGLITYINPASDKFTRTYSIPNDPELLSSAWGDRLETFLLDSSSPVSRGLSIVILTSSTQLGFTPTGGATGTIESLIPTATGASILNVSSSPSDTSDPAARTLSSGAIAGIVIGVASIVAIAAILLTLFVVRKRLDRRRNAEDRLKSFNGIEKDGRMILQIEAAEIDGVVGAKVLSALDVQSKALPAHDE